MKPLRIPWKFADPCYGDTLWARVENKGMWVWHAGILTENFTAIHRTSNAGIVESSLFDFSDSNEIFIEPHSESSMPRELVIARAKNKIGESGYGLVFRNCIHFVNFCRRGVAYCPQVNTGLTVLAVVVVIGLLVRTAKKQAA